MSDSKYQLAVYDAVRNTNHNICVQACPGGGKTTTSVKALQLIPRTKKVVFLSFSNAIVNELKARVPSHVLASTLHSLGAKMIFRGYDHKRNKKLKVDEQKYFKIIAYEFFTEEDRKDKTTFKQIYEILDIVNMARMTLTPLEEEPLKAMCDYYGFVWSTDHFRIAIEAITKERRLTSIDFTDMIYLPATRSYLIDVKYDYVFLDEAQDLNKAQRVFLQRLMGEKGRLVAVGDVNQSIYSFAGADIQSFQSLQSLNNTITLPLSVSYRCPIKVVEEANKIWPGSVEPYEKAIKGVVRESLCQDIALGDLVVSRITAPLVKIFFYLLGEGIPARIVGKDYEKGLIKLIKKVQAPTSDKVQEKIAQQFEKILKDLAAMGYPGDPKKHQKYTDLEEKVAVIDILLENTHPSMLVDEVEKMFDEDLGEHQKVTLMTIHRSKGLEADRVFCVEKWDQKTMLPYSRAEKDWEEVQEKNLQFVAYTRAKKELHFLSIVKKDEDGIGYGQIDDIRLRSRSEENCDYSPELKEKRDMYLIRL